MCEMPPGIVFGGSWKRIANMLQVTTDAPKAPPKPPAKAKPRAKAPAKAAPAKKAKAEPSDGRISVPQLAEMLSKNRKERVRKSFIRKVLDKAGWEKRNGLRYFLPGEVEKAKKLILDSLK
jgi:hypothetical protein